MVVEIELVQKSQFGSKKVNDPTGLTYVVEKKIKFADVVSLPTSLFSETGIQFFPITTSYSTSIPILISNIWVVREQIFVPKLDRFLTKRY